MLSSAIPVDEDRAVDVVRAAGARVAGIGVLDRAEQPMHRRGVEPWQVAGEQHDDRGGDELQARDDPGRRPAACRVLAGPHDRPGDSTRFTDDDDLTRVGDGAHHSVQQRHALDRQSGLVGPEPTRPAARDDDRVVASRRASVLGIRHAPSLPMPVGRGCQACPMTDDATWIDEEFLDEDWYGRDLSGETYRGCTFREVDLTEAESRGAFFESCEFDNCRLNASTHTDTAFVACQLRRTSLFGATLDGCKLTGTMFVECTLRPLTVRAGQWRSVLLRGAKLSGLELDGVDLQEADLQEADLTGASLLRCDLSRSSLRSARLDEADLRGANLQAADLAFATLRGTTLDLAGAVAVAEAQGAVVEVAPE
jgi:uncharacterized protein YjbI with pentapeptide repeats